MSLLIIGKIPPPTGGVTIHVSRLIQRLEKSGIEFKFLNLEAPIISILKETLKNDVIHLHASNPYFRFAYSLLCFVIGKKLIQTYHGDLNRYRLIKNLFDSLSIRLSDVPIVINIGSNKIAQKLNRKTILLSAFIMPVVSSPLPEELKRKLEEWGKKYQNIFCTNASALQYDKFGDEIYGGTELIKLFRNNPQLGLIFSDPTSEYLNYWNRINGYVPGNIYFINQEHDFSEIIKYSVCLIRATTTDGDSISVKEALSFGKSVIASDCVDRPKDCLLFKTNDYFHLQQILDSSNFEESPPCDVYDGFFNIIQNY